MSAQAIIGQGGYAGWRLLSRTADSQRSMVARDPQVSRENSYYKEKIGTVATADDLVSDYRLLRTTLTAFGLENDLNSRFFIKRVLESDLGDPASLVNRLSDKRYRKLAETFRLDQGGSKLTRPGFADGIVERHVAAEFERRVGTQDGNLRLALNAQRELPLLAAASSSDNTKWYTILGSAPLRKVVEGALGMGAEYGRVPVDRQLQDMKDRALSAFGISSARDLQKPEIVEKMIQRFLLRAQATTPSQSSYSAALALLTA